MRAAPKFTICTAVLGLKMRQQSNPLRVVALLLLGLMTAPAFAGSEDILLTLSTGTTNEVTLSWDGGQSPFVVYCSNDPTSVVDPGNVIGETDGYSWVDNPPAGVIYYDVAEMALPEGGLVNQIWSGGWGTSGAAVWPNDISIAPGDEILVSGRYDGSVNFGDGALTGGVNNVFLTKIAADGGQTLWSVGFDDGQTGSTLVSSGAVSDSAGNSYLTGYFRYQTNFGGVSLTPDSGFDMFIVKLSPSGSVIWARKYGGGGNQYAKSIAVNSSDEILVAGKFSGSANVGGSALPFRGGDDIFLAKFDSDGNHIWSVGFGSSNSDDVFDLDVQGDEIAISGFYKATGADFGGSPLGYIGFEDAFVAKYRDTGSSPAHLFSRGFGSPYGDKAYGVAIDPVSGDVAVTGVFDGVINFGGPTTYPDTGGGVDMFVLKLDASGNWVGDQAFGDTGTYSINGRDVIIDVQGNVVVTGDTSIPVDFGGGLLPGSSQDVFLVRFDANLAQHLWSGRYGYLIGGDVGRSLALNSADELLLCGDFWTSITFDGVTIQSQGTPDLFVAAFTTAP